MKHNSKKTKAQLVQEVTDLRQQVAELETLEVKHREFEEALAYERNLLRTLIDNLPDFAYFKDTQSRFLIANPAVARLMGATHPDELIGKTDFDFYPQSLATRFYTDEQAIIASGQSLINREEPVIDCTTNEDRWILTTKIPLWDSQNRVVGLVGLGRDISDWKQAQEALQQSKQQIQNILESITDAFFAVDNDWRFTYVNQRAEQILRKTRDQLLGNILWVEFPEIVGSKFYAEYQHAIAEHITVEFEEYYKPLQAWFKVHGGKCRAWPWL
jgi:PAS domain S-box-containing protein